MDRTARWCTHGLVGILGIIGLFLAAGAVDRWTYVFNLAVTAFAVLYAFILVKQGLDTLECAAIARLRRAARIPRITEGQHQNGGRGPAMRDISADPAADFRNATDRNGSR